MSYFSCIVLQVCFKAKINKIAELWNLAQVQSGQRCFLVKPSTVMITEYVDPTCHSLFGKSGRTDDPTWKPPCIWTFT